MYNIEVKDEDAAEMLLRCLSDLVKLEVVKFYCVATRPYPTVRVQVPEVLEDVDQLVT